MLVLWDTIFAIDPSLDLIDLICVAMLIRIRWSCKLFLLQPTRIRLLLTLRQYWKRTTRSACNYSLSILLHKHLTVLTRLSTTPCTLRATSTIPGAHRSS
jgi:hypothetical protein